MRCYHAGVDFLGTSGQNVDDLDMYTSIGDRLDVMEATLRWQHLAPSAPDTLGAPSFQPPRTRSPHALHCTLSPDLTRRACVVDTMNKEAKSSQETATHDTERAN